MLFLMISGNVGHDFDPKSDESPSVDSRIITEQTLGQTNIYRKALF